MIEPMKKVFVAGSRAHEERILTALRAAGVVHLRPSQDRDRTVDHLERDRLHSRAQKAKAIAQRHDCESTPDAQPFDPALVDEIIALQQHLEDAASAAASAQAEIEQLGPWAHFGDDFLESLAQRGRQLGIFDVPAKERFEPDADLVFEIEGAPSSFKRYVVMSRGDAPMEAVKPMRAVPRPDRSATQLARTLGEELAAVDAVRSELARLSSTKEGLAAYIERLEDERELARAQSAATRYENIMALEGWIPASKVDRLRAVLDATGIDFALNLRDPEPADDPPTLVEYRPVTEPVSVIFNILGALPGYRERDVSGPFLVALPFFTAMLVADGGYGLVFLLAGVLGYKAISRRMSAQAAQLLVIIGACSLLWGFAIGSFFGVGPEGLERGGGGIWAKVGAILESLRLVDGDFTQDDVVSQIMRLSFIIGAVHMSSAELWRARLFYPDTKALAHVGWAVFLWGMLLAVQLLVLEDPRHPAMIPLLAVGAVTVIVFAHQHKNPILRLVFGLAEFPLAALGTLSDTISYVRLMAVGLASTILAATFNELAFHAAQSATWVIGGLILVLGHGLNIGLAIIALFAHGVRLNMLEFSGHLGMSWNGYPYAPWAPRKHLQR